MPLVIEKALAAGENVGVRPLAKMAGVSPSTLYRAIERNELEVTRIGTRITIPAHVARQLRQFIHIVRRRA